MSSTKQMSLLLMTILSSLQYLSVSSFEYEIGANEGWVVPPANDTRIYNDWASENRFQVDDTIRFKYRKDSVMEVSVEDYKKCNSSHPNFFSNTGNTVYHLNHSGYFYFISGVSGHCERGQRMIIKVISSDQETNSGGEKSSASPSAPVLSSGVFKALSSQLAMSYVASYVFY
ncbi:PREDICTED: mavicyanin [Populus euphratica]|uniref:Mavicyanin n=1 Tax=Populus euphratica TaxID=75702 RepID=A0AAJ6VBN8_POPEU|nr:PREDICTED: mavicyanin [Populus euphratica]